MCVAVDVGESMPSTHLSRDRTNTHTYLLTLTSDWTEKVPHKSNRKQTFIIEGSCFFCFFFCFVLLNLFLELFPLERQESTSAGSEGAGPHLNPGCCSYVVCAVDQ